jgi:hypothetical protein
MDFIDDGECTAEADIYDMLGVVGLSKGAVMLPVEIFSSAFAHPLVFEGIGDRSEERVNPQHAGGLPYNYDVLINARKNQGQKTLPIMPVDRLRRLAAQLCMEMFWSFVAMHEIVHIVHGHVDAMYAGEFKDDLDFQAAEIWADSKATSVPFKGFLKDTSDPHVQEICPMPEQRIVLWSFAIFILFRVLKLVIDPGNLRGPIHHHPPTAMRFSAAMQAAMLDSIEVFPEMKDKFMPACHAGQLEAEKAISYCGGERLKTADVSGVKDTRAARHYEAILKRMETRLLPLLKKYSYVELTRP